MDNWNHKQKIITQIVCLLLSIGLWFYVINVENPVITQDINKYQADLNGDSMITISDLAILRDKLLS